MADASYTVEEFARLAGVARSTVYNNARNHPDRLSITPVYVGTRLTFPASMVHEKYGISPEQAKKILSGIDRDAEVETKMPDFSKIDPNNTSYSVAEQAEAIDQRNFYRSLNDDEREAYFLIQQRKIRDGAPAMKIIDFAGVKAMTPATIPVTREEIEKFQEEERQARQAWLETSGWAP